MSKHFLQDISKTVWQVIIQFELKRQRINSLCPGSWSRGGQHHRLSRSNRKNLRMEGSCGDRPRDEADFCTLLTVSRVVAAAIGLGVSFIQTFETQYDWFRKFDGVVSGSSLAARRSLAHY